MYIYIYTYYISVDILFSQYQVLRTHTVHTFFVECGWEFLYNPFNWTLHTRAAGGNMFEPPLCWAKRPHVAARIQGHPTLPPPRNTQKFDKKSTEKWSPGKKSPQVAKFIWVVSTHSKNMSQIGSFPQVGEKIKYIWNHQSCRSRRDS